MDHKLHKTLALTHEREQTYRRADSQKQIFQFKWSLRNIDKSKALMFRIKIFKSKLLSASEKANVP